MSETAVATEETVIDDMITPRVLEELGFDPGDTSWSTNYISGRLRREWVVLQHGEELFRVVGRHADGGAARLCVEGFIRTQVKNELSRGLSPDPLTTIEKYNLISTEFGGWGSKTQYSDHAKQSAEVVASAVEHMEDYTNRFFAAVRETLVKEFGDQNAMGGGAE